MEKVKRGAEVYQQLKTGGESCRGGQSLHQNGGKGVEIGAWGCKNGHMDIDEEDLTLVGVRQEDGEVKGG